MSIQGFRDLNLTRDYGFLAQRSEQHPHVAVLLPSVDRISPDESRLATKEQYHDALKQMAEAGVRRVVVDAGFLDLSPAQKLALAYMKPSADEVRGIDAIYIGGVTPEDIRTGAHSGHAAESMARSPGIKPTIEEAIAECLR